MSDEYIQRVQSAIDKAESNVTELPQSVFDMEGMSSRKNRIFLNELIADEDRYLEIGTYKGSTFVSALHGNSPKTAIAIDNFAQFGGPREEFKRNCEENGISYKFIDADCFGLTPEDKASIQDINVYFYDGDHREIDQYRALTYYYENLSDTFIFIVDDWNHSPVPVGTRNAIADKNVTVLKEWILPARYNGDQEGWWNGLYVAVCKK